MSTSAATIAALLDLRADDDRLGVVVDNRRVQAAARTAATLVCGAAALAALCFGVNKLDVRRDFSFAGTSAPSQATLSILEVANCVHLLDQSGPWTGRIGGRDVLVGGTPWGKRLPESFRPSVPGAMVFLGATPPELDPAAAPFNHSPEARFEESVMTDGVTLYADFARRALTSPPPSGVRRA